MFPGACDRDYKIVIREQVVKVQNFVLEGVRKMGKLRKNPVLLSVLMLAFGVILVAKPGLTLQVVVRLLGIGLLVGGAIVLWGYFNGKDEEKVSYLNLFGGLLAAAAGFVVLVRPSIIVNLFPTIMGIIAVLNGVLNLTKSLDLKKNGLLNWQPPCILALITVVLGIIVLLNPFSTMKVLIMAVGVMLIYNGASSVFIHTRKAGASMRKSA